MTDVYTYAGFWRRAFAFLFDLFWKLPLVAFLTFLFGGSTFTSRFITFGLVCIINAFFESSKWQGSPGKKILDIRVTNLKGLPLGFGQAFGRNVCKILSAVILFIGYMMAGWTLRKQALHDKLMDCLVIKSIPEKF